MGGRTLKYKITAVIPVAQYANLQPCLEVEADTFEEAQALVMPHIETVWAQYGEKPLRTLPSSPVVNNTQTLTDLFGNQINYDSANHVYSWNGDVYQSGSQYAKQFEKPFDGIAIAAKMADKYKVNAEDIADMWSLKARTSREFGTALHSALELHGKYKALSSELERETSMHDHPVIKSAVESFYKGRDDERALYEVLVVDHKNKRAGQIDRLLVNGENDYTVQDFKCNAVMNKDKLKVYFEQLNFYGGIIKENGGKTHPPEIFHYDGSWHEYKETT